MATTFSTRLTGAEQIPPVATLTRGEAHFRLNESRTRLQYNFTINNIQGLTMAHIHLGRRGQNGPVVAPLLLVDPNINATSVTAAGVITRDDLVGPLAGQPLSTLIDNMVSGNTYVNAHTVRYPDGEIRGQIRRDDNQN